MQRLICKDIFACMQHSGIIPDFQGSGFCIVLRKALVWKISKIFFSSILGRCNHGGLVRSTLKYLPAALVVSAPGTE